MNPSSHAFPCNPGDWGIETNLTTRWEKGMDHHKESEAMYRIIEDMDFRYGNDYFCWKSGGDGDNGEHLMYLLDIHFEMKDEQKRRKAQAIEEAFRAIEGVTFMPFSAPQE